MKSLISAVLIASALIAPAVSFAQQANVPLTRAQVRAEIVTAQKAGLLYQNDTEYPKLAALGSQDVGGVSAVSSEAGAPVAVEQGLFSTYRGH